MSIALARRYRPRHFADLLVQDHVAQALSGAVAKNRVGHGYLLTGPRGVGKTTAARILAMALNCERRDSDNPTGEPCGDCPSCERIWHGQTSLDVVEIDAASNRGVDDARSLRESAMYAASQKGHHKVYIVDEAHMLTREAWNTLLKILEEPPPGVVFVFATTEPQKIANTAAPVLSRLQRFDFRRIGATAIRERLRTVLLSEGVDASDDALLLIARHADGGMRDALSVLDQCLSFGDGPLTAERVRDVLGLVNDETLGQLLEAVADRNPAAVFPVIDELSDAGADLVEAAGALGELLRAMLMQNLGAAVEELPEVTRQIVDSLAPRMASEDLVRMLKLLGEAEPALRRSAEPRLVLELLVLRWAMMDRALDLKALLMGQGAISGHSDGGATTRVARTEPAHAGGEATTRVAHTEPAHAGGEAPTRVARTEPAHAGGEAPTRVAPTAPTYAVPWTVEGIKAVWGEIVEVVRRQSPMLGMALEAAVPEPQEQGKLRLRFLPDQTMMMEGIEAKRGSIAAAIGERLGTRVAVEVVSTGRASAPPGRLTEAGHREARLAELRSRNPELDAVANALDLELVDESQ